MGFSFKYLSIASTITIFVTLFAILYQGYLVSNNLRKLTNILANLIYLEHNYEKSVDLTRPKVLIGYGSCSDLYVQAPEFLNYSESLISGFQNRNGEDDEIITEEDFYKSFTYYFSKGAAAERFTPNVELFQNLVNRAKKHPTHKWSLGGNAPIMGNRFTKEGADVLLVATMSKKLKTHLHEGVKLSGEGNGNEKDDIHLILEYKTGDTFGDVVSPRANRYILHNDFNNPMIKSLELIEYKNFDPRLFVVSGLQMMDNYPFEDMRIRDEKLSIVKAQMNDQKKSTLIHFEMASYVDIDMLQSLMRYIVPYTDSLGMNEQELDNILQVLEHGKVSLSADSNPRVATALSQMRKVFKILNNEYYENSGSDSDRRLISRIHVHTLAYQAILTVKNSEWRNSKSAAAKAALTANRHVCNSNVINPENAYLILDDSFSTDIENDINSDDSRPSRIVFDEFSPVACWNETISVNKANRLNVEICISPVLVCKVAKQTVGAGDNISSSGLILQI